MPLLSPIGRPLRGHRQRWRRSIRRHRRPLAAVLAAAAVVIGLGSLRGSPSVAQSESAPTSKAAGIGIGQAAVPIVLSSPAIARSLEVGDVVDIVGVTGSESATATVVAREARIIDMPDAGSTFTASSAPVLVVAVRESDALSLIAASASGGLSVLVRGS